MLLCAPKASLFVALVCMQACLQACRDAENSQQALTGHALSPRRRLRKSSCRI